MQQLIAELTRPVVLSDRSLRQLAALKRAHQAFLTDTVTSRPPASSPTTLDSRTHRSKTCWR
jgi:hypothetical protein